MKKSLELQVFIVEPLVIFFEFFVIDVKSLKLNLKEFLPRSWNLRHFFTCTGTVLCRKLPQEQVQMLSELFSIFAKDQFLAEVSELPSLFHWMHGRVGYNFAEWVRTYPKDVEITRFRCKLIHKQLQGLVKSAADLHRSVIHLIFKLNYRKLQSFY